MKVNHNWGKRDLKTQGLERWPVGGVAHLLFRGPQVSAQPPHWRTHNGSRGSHSPSGSASTALNVQTHRYTHS